MSTHYAHFAGPAWRKIRASSLVPRQAVDAVEHGRMLALLFLRFGFAINRVCFAINRALSVWLFVYSARGVVLTASISIFNSISRILLRLFDFVYHDGEQ